jgi:hypothetical protein
MVLRLLGYGMICLILMAGQSRSGTPDNNPESVFYRYLEALKSMQWSEAEECWAPDYVEVSRRLGITYEGIPAKYDCASPLVRIIDGISGGGVGVSVDSVEIEDDWARILLQLVTATDTAAISYYAVRAEGGWRLDSPLRILTRSWDTCHTRYTTIRYTDKGRLNKYACQAMDEFIESCGRQLGLSDDDLGRLEKTKIDYYLCNDDQIQALTGYNTQGMADLPSDAVVTRHLPHKHELVHLMINYALKELPLYTLPFMQEGLACCLGGRWGRSPEVLSYTGYACLKYELADLDDILTFSDFRSTIGSPDISYPISALFVKHMIEDVGIEDFKRLYLELSGNDEDVRFWPIDHVRSVIQDAWNKPWEAIDHEFDQWWPAFVITNITPLSGKPEIDTRMEMSPRGGFVTYLDQDKTVNFFVKLKDEITKGFILLKDPDCQADREYSSRLFHQHLPDEEYGGERYGFRLSPGEIGFYDYYCDELVASYVFDFSFDHDSSGIARRNLEDNLYFLSIPRSILGIDRNYEFEEKLVTY